MTGFAVIRGIDMTGILACRCGAVVTGGAATDNIIMINLGSRRPAGRGVAAFTTVSGIDMG